MEAVPLNLLYSVPIRVYHFVRLCVQMLPNQTIVSSLVVTPEKLEMLINKTINKDIVAHQQTTTERIVFINQ